MRKFMIFCMIISFVFYISAKDKKEPPKYLYKIASEAPDGSIWVESIKKINREIYKDTKGNVAIRIYPGGIMGDQSTVIKRIKTGQLSGCTFSSAGMDLLYKDFAVMGFPMVFRNYEEYDYVKKKMSSFFEKKYADRGYVLLAWTEVGLIYLYSKKKVHSIASLKTSKPFLVEGDTISLALYDKIDASPVPLQMSDVMTGLQTGLIDTIFSSPYGLIVMQWFTKVKYMASFPITLMIGAIMVEKELFDSMPKEYQVMMKDMFSTTFDNLNSKVRQDNRDAQISLKENGLVVLPVDKKDSDVFINVANSVAYDLTEKEYSRELYNEIVKHVEDFRKSK